MDFDGSGKFSRTREVFELEKYFTENEIISIIRSLNHNKKPTSAATISHVKPWSPVVQLTAAVVNFIHSVLASLKESQHNCHYPRTKLLSPLVWKEGRVLEQTFWKFTEAIFCTEKNIDFNLITIFHGKER